MNPSKPVQNGVTISASGNIGLPTSRYYACPCHTAPEGSARESPHTDHPIRRLVGHSADLIRPRGDCAQFEYNAGLFLDHSIWTHSKSSGVHGELPLEWGDLFRIIVKIRIIGA